MGFFKASDKELKKYEERLEQEAEQKEKAKEEKEKELARIQMLRSKPLKEQFKISLQRKETWIAFGLIIISLILIILRIVSNI